MDLQSMTLPQAEFVLVGNNVDEQVLADAETDSKFEILSKVADHEGITLYQLGRLGADVVAAKAAAFTGRPINVDHITPLYTEPEFLEP